MLCSHVVKWKIRILYYAFRLSRTNSYICIVVITIFPVLSQFSMSNIFSLVCYECVLCLVVTLYDTTFRVNYVTFPP